MIIGTYLVRGTEIDIETLYPEITGSIDLDQENVNNQIIVFQRVFDKYVWTQFLEDPWHWVLYAYYV